MVNERQMEKEYQIKCTPPKGQALKGLLARLPSPISRPEMREIYNYCINEDDIYFVDRLVNAEVASRALGIFVEAALEASGSSIEISHL